MHRFIAILAAALMVLALVAPVSAATPGTLLIKGTPGAVVDKDGTLTLRFTYNCVQYDAPYNGLDTIGANIYQFGAVGHYSTTYFNYVTCDGTDRRLTLVLTAFDGGQSGAVTLVIGHQGNIAGSTGFANEFGTWTGTIKVVQH